jgi:type III secretion protein N (ATPase)
VNATGTVRSVLGGIAEVAMPALALGSHVWIDAPPSGVTGVVCGVEGDRLRVTLHGAGEGIAAGARVRESPESSGVMLGTCALGRAIDAQGDALDGLPPLRGRRVPIDSDAPLARTGITHPLWTGVKTIDALLTIGRGARVGLFGSPGAGKSTLLETIVRGTQADAVVVGLIGERGREAQRWIDACSRRMTVVCATSDRSAGERVRAGHAAMAHARALASRGLHVLLILDSLARVAGALRELAVVTGESVGRGGYPPSVFAAMARLLERAGAFERGSVSLLVTVLNDGEDRDPVSEAARSLLDGHIQLSLDLAASGHFPAIDVPQSASRTMTAVADESHARAAAAVRRAIALLQRANDARSLGIEPQDESTRAAIGAETAIEELVLQNGAPVRASGTLAMLAATADMLLR